MTFCFIEQCPNGYHLLVSKQILWHSFHLLLRETAKLIHTTQAHETHLWLASHRHFEGIHAATAWQAAAITAACGLRCEEKLSCHWLCKCRETLLAQNGITGHAVNDGGAVTSTFALVAFLTEHIVLNVASPLAPSSAGAARLFIRERRIECHAAGFEVELLHEFASLASTGLAIHAWVFPFDG